MKRNSLVKNLQFAKPMHLKNMSAPYISLNVNFAIRISQQITICRMYESKNLYTRAHFNRSLKMHKVKDCFSNKSYILSRFTQQLHRVSTSATHRHRYSLADTTHTY